MDETVIPARLAPILFGLILSGLMSLIVCGVAALKTSGVGPNFFDLWISTWIPSWMVAFPTVLIVAPMTRKLIAKMVRQD